MQVAEGHVRTYYMPLNPARVRLISDLTGRAKCFANASWLTKSLYRQPRSLINWQFKYNVHAQCSAWSVYCGRLTIKSCININHFKCRCESMENASYQNLTQRPKLNSSSAMCEFWNSLECLVEDPSPALSVSDTDGWWRRSWVYW